MNIEKIKNELYSFYLKNDVERSKAFAKKCFAIMDTRYKEGMSVTQQKLLQYDVITEQFEPVIFRNIPFYFETGVLTSLSDGAPGSKVGSFIQANGWVHNKNQHLFVEQDSELWKKRTAHLEEKLYLICGHYNDECQHYNFNFRSFIQIGFKGVYNQAEKALETEKNDEAREFLQSVCYGMVTMRKMAEKFAEKANFMLQTEENNECRENLKRIAEVAQRVPWEAPKTFYEGLATLAFLRTAVGSLEGVGPNTFGRIDKDLINLYNSDIEKGTITPVQAYELICQFLLIWDCHYDHNMPMVGYSDHELENTYTLGGCDDDGKPICNELTIMFLRATRELKIIFPKIKCRFSSNSPKKYLDEINTSILQGTTVVLLQNDDATIPALVRAGRTLKEARDYLVTGCWGVTTYQEKYDHGSYLNLLKAFEIPLHNLKDKMEKTEIHFKTFDSCGSFEEFYQTVLLNCELLIDAKLEVTTKGGQIFHKVNRFPIFSSAHDNCLEKRKDFTMKGSKYQDDFLLMFGFPDIVDSMLAVKELVFDQKKYSLNEFLKAVRNNWENNENMRIEATCCAGWGDGEKASCELANRFNNDLFKICQKKTGTYGGKVNMGHLTYTEILWWGKSTLATPNGRKSGDYFAQGLTPSRLKRIPCVLDAFNSMGALEASEMAANSVINIMLPHNISVDNCESLLRTVANTATQSLQLNCVSRSTLLDAQKIPKKYPDLIVRVTGFSAKFTSLSEEWQNEILSRNFYNS